MDIFFKLLRYKLLFFDCLLVLSSLIILLFCITYLELKNEIFQNNIFKLNIKDKMKNIQYNNLSFYFFEKKNKSIFNNKFKISMCLIIKMGNRFINDWLNYYNSLGVSKILIADNNDFKGEIVESIILKHISSKFVKIINLKGEKDIRRQDFFYNYCYHLFKKEYDWIYNLDDDEFLTLNNSKMTLYNFHNLDIYKNCSCIFPFFKVYDDGDLLYLNKSIKPFYKYYKPIPPKLYPLRFYKTLIRGKINHVRLTIHFPVFYNKKNYCCFTNGDIPKYVTNRYHNITFKNAYIKHFLYKSTYDICTKFFKRGCINSRLKKIRTNIIAYNYFKYNKITLEKIRILEKCTNHSFDEERLKIGLKYDRFNKRIKNLKII